MQKFFPRLQTTALIWISFAFVSTELLCLSSFSETEDEFQADTDDHPKELGPEDPL